MRVRRKAKNILITFIILCAISIITAFTLLGGSEKIKIYNNVAYHYTLQYKDTIVVQGVQEEEGSSVDHSGEIVLFKPGEKGAMRITSCSTLGSSVFLRNCDQIYMGQFSDLRNFAEFMQTHERSGTVEKLKNLEFKGQTAFSYEVRGEQDGYGRDSGTYLLLENKGNRYIIYYSQGCEYAEFILRTLQFL